jgi:hypothetical protein
MKLGEQPPVVMVERAPRNASTLAWGPFFCVHDLELKKYPMMRRTIPVALGKLVAILLVGTLTNANVLAEYLVDAMSNAPQSTDVWVSALSAKMAETPSLAIMRV